MGGVGVGRVGLGEGSLKRNPCLQCTYCEGRHFHIYKLSQIFENGQIRV